MTPSLPQTTAALPAASSGSLAALGRAIAGTLVSNMSVFLFSLATSVIINRSLGPAGKGVYAMILTGAQLLALCASLGLAKSVTYHIARGGEGQDRCFGTSLSLGLLTLGLSPAMLVLLAQCTPPGAWQDLFRQFFWPILFLVALFQLQGYGLGALRGLQQFTETSLLQPANNLIFLAFLLLCAVLGTVNLHTALFSKVAAALAIVLFLVWRLEKRFPFRPRLDRATATGLVGYGLGYFGYTVFQNLNYRFDVVLVSSFTDAAHTGWYATATGLAEILWFLPNAIGMVLLPVVVGTCGESGDWLAARVCRISLPIMMAGVLILVAVADGVVRWLYGPDFLPAAEVIHALALGILTNGLYTVLGTHLASRNKLGLLMTITCLGFTVNVLLNLWWIPLYGIVGAGLASSVSYSTTALLTAHAFSKITGIPWPQFLIIDRGEATALLRYARQRVARLRHLLP